MFTRIMFTIMMALLLMVSVAIAGDDAKPIEKAGDDAQPIEKAGDNAQPGEEAKEVTLKNQTHCPVMGGKIDSSIYTDIQGQRVYHCCPACSKPLQKDPDQYFKKASDAGVLFENIQTTCPVSGKELKEKMVFTDYEGRRVYFFCEDCIPKFEKDPQKFLTALDQPAEKTESKMEMPKDEHDHSAHDHGGH